MAISLPDVVQDWTANVTEYLAAMQEAAEAALEAAAAVKTLQGVIDSLHGKNIDIGINAAQASAAAAATENLATATQNLNGAEAILAHELPDISADLMMQTALLREMTSTLADMRTMWMEVAAAAAAGGAASGGAGAKVAAAGAAAGGAAAGLGFFARWWPLIHWGLTITYEALAVLIPALVALGAGLLVASDGAQQVYHWLGFLQTATSALNGAFGQTTGSVLGLGSALSNAQDAAKPGVYEILGAVLNGLRGQMGGFANEGLQVVHIFDQFAAKISIDLQSSMGQIHGLLAGGIADLVMFGQILGNVGHALLNFASAAPGLAQVLLGIADAVSKVILWLSQMPQWLLTTLIVWHEFYMWGGLVASMLTRLATVIPMLGPMIMGSIVNTFMIAGRVLGGIVSVGAAVVSGLSGLIGLLARIIPGAAGASAALNGLAASMDRVAANTKLLGGIAVGLAAVAGAAVYLDHLRNATQQYIDKTNQAVAQAPTMVAALQALAQGYAGATLRLQQNSQALASYSPVAIAVGSTVANMVGWLQKTAPPLGGVAQGFVNAATGSNKFLAATTGLVGSFLGLFGGATQAATGIGDLQRAQNQWAAQGASMVTNAQTLATKFGVTLPAAFEMANAAGVNLIGTWGKNSFAMQQAVAQINNLKTGLGAMTAPAGVLGADMTALAVQSGLAATKVQQVNAAFDQMFSLVSSGIGNFSQLIQSVHNMQNATASTSTTLGGSFTSISTGASNAQYSLKGLGQNAMQSLQQVVGALSTAEQEMNFFQTAMAAGAVTGPQFAQSIKDIVGIMAPFAKGNAAVAASLSVLAQRGGLAGGSVKQLAQEAGIHGKAAIKALEASVNSASVKLANMSTVAQHLGTVMQTQLSAGFSTAVLNSLHYNNAVKNLATTLMHYPANSAQAQAAVTKLNNIQKTATAIGHKYDIATRQNAQAALQSATAHKHLASAESASAAAAKLVGDSAKNASGDMHTLSAAAAATAASLDKHHISAKIAAISTLDLQGKVAGLSSTESGSQGTRDTVNQQLQRMQTQSQTTATAVFNLQQKITNAAGAALTAAAKMLTLGTAMATAGNQAMTAAGKVYSLQSAIAGLQSKTITITTNMVTTSTHRAAGGPVAAGMPYTVGEAGPELFVPFQSGMILPAPETRQFMSGGGSAGGGGFSGGGPQVINAHLTIDNHVNMDGQEVWRGQQRRTLQYNVRNGGAQSGTVAPGKGG